MQSLSMDLAFRPKAQITWRLASAFVGSAIRVVSRLFASVEEIFYSNTCKVLWSSFLSCSSLQFLVVLVTVIFHPKASQCVLNPWKIWPYMLCIFATQKKWHWKSLWIAMNTTMCFISNSYSRTHAFKTIITGKPGYSLAWESIAILCREVFSAEFHTHRRLYPQIPSFTQRSR